MNPSSSRSNATKQDLMQQNINKETRKTSPCSPLKPFWILMDNGLLIVQNRTPLPDHIQGTYRQNLTSPKPANTLNTKPGYRFDTSVSCEALEALRPS